jgi:hypothetical protein
MFRVLTILAAIVALLASAAPVASAHRPEVEVGLLDHDAVAVGEDGNGVAADRFATTVAGSGVRYVLVVENGCAEADPLAGLCPAPVTGLTITLNDDVVFENSEPFTTVRQEIVLNPVAGELNSLVLAAHGAPGSAARVRIVAVRGAPLDQA